MGDSNLIHNVHPISSNPCDAKKRRLYFSERDHSTSLKAVASLRSSSSQLFNFDVGKQVPGVDMVLKLNQQLVKADFFQSTTPPKKILQFSGNIMHTLCTPNLFIELMLIVAIIPFDSSLLVVSTNAISGWCFLWGHQSLRSVQWCCWKAANLSSLIAAAHQRPDSPQTRVDDILNRPCAKRLEKYNPCAFLTLEHQSSYILTNL